MGSRTFGKSLSGQVPHRGEPAGKRWLRSVSYTHLTFGLFAAEELTASDGTSIPADGLMETIGIDENGNAIFKTDVPLSLIHI